MKAAGWILTLFGAALGCAAPAAPEQHAGRIAILPVNNRTGDPLLVTGDGLLDRYVFHAETVTIPDVLEAEADLNLQEKGFDLPPPPRNPKAPKVRVPTSASDALEVAAQAGLGPLCLYLEIRRWEPEGRVHVKYVIVDVAGTLVDTTSRRVVWQSERRGPIPTPGQVMLEAASVEAARKAIADLLAPLHPEPPSPH